MGRVRDRKDQGCKIMGICSQALFIIDLECHNELMIACVNYLSEWLNF